jgi:hypothetical protein
VGLHIHSPYIFMAKYSVGEAQQQLSLFILSIGWRIILKWSVNVKTYSNWLRIGSSGELL